MGRTPSIDEDLVGNRPVRVADRRDWVLRRPIIASKHQYAMRVPQVLPVLHGGFYAYEIVAIEVQHDNRRIAKSFRELADVGGFRRSTRWLDRRDGDFEGTASHNLSPLKPSRRIGPTDQDVDIRLVYLRRDH